MPASNTQVEDLIPEMRARARLWVGTTIEADNIVCLALEMAIDRVETRRDDLQKWLFFLLEVARDAYFVGRSRLPCVQHPAQPHR